MGFSSVSTIAAETNLTTKIIKPNKKLFDFCVNYHCDYQVFYRYLDTHKPRFCREKSYIVNNKKKFNILKRVLYALDDRSLPLTIVSLPLVESSLNLNAKASNHHSSAVGLWQLKPETGKDMGLIVKSTLDERLDFEKSTNAALNYLQWLEKKFDNQNLAILAYHVGITKLQRMIDIYGTTNSWYLSQLLSHNKYSKDYLLRYYSYSAILLGYEDC